MSRSVKRTPRQRAIGHASRRSFKADQGQDNHACHHADGQVERRRIELRGRQHAVRRGANLTNVLRRGPTVADPSGRAPIGCVRDTANGRAAGSRSSAIADPKTHLNRHYHGDGEVIGVRMGQLFDIAKRATDMPLDEVSRLLDRPEYEPRLAAFCVLDFAVRRPRTTENERAERYRLYLDRHDRIDSWDMVDRAAPRVIGEYLRNRSRQPLFELAEAADPLRRRTAITAPLIYTRPAHPDGIADLLRIAEALLHDPDPVVWKPVGIALKHAGGVAPDAVLEFLGGLGDRVPAPIQREARIKLPK